MWLSWTLYLYFLPLSGSFLVVSMNKYRKRLKTDGHYWFQSAISSYYICTYILMYTYVVCTTIVRILTRKLWIEEVIHRFACIFRCTYLVCNCNLYSKLYIPSAIKTQMKLTILLSFGSKEIFCNFSKLVYFWWCFIMFSWAKLEFLIIKNWLKVD